MASNDLHPLTVAATHHEKSVAPGLGTVLSTVIKDAVIFTLIGGAMGAVAAGAMGAVLGSQEVLDMLSQRFFSISLGGTLTSLIATGGTIGALTGGLIGVPTGGIEGVTKLQHYYNDVAIPDAAKKAEAHGLEYCIEPSTHTPEREQERAQAKESETFKYRDIIAQAKEQPLTPGVGI